MPVPLRLLIVCLGNICRSPMAEGAMRVELAAAGLADLVEVDSCGTGHWHVGAPPDPRAIACSAGSGVDIGDLRARQLSPADFDAFDFILCADHATLRRVVALAPERARDKCMLLASYAGHGDVDIPDPYNGDMRDFERVWTLVDGMAQAIVRRLAATRA